MLTREICKICNQVNRVGYDVPDNIWKIVIPPEYQQKVVCLNCFTKLGDLYLIPWDKNIKFYPVSLVTHSCV